MTGAGITEGWTKGGALDFSPYLSLLTEVGDLKRVRAAHLGGSVASGMFSRCWSSLAAGSDSGELARETAAATLRAARLGAVDEGVLAGGGLSPKEIPAVLTTAFDAVASPVPEPLRGELRRTLQEVALNQRPESQDQAPGFTGALGRQPRAGATRPGRPRLMLEPPENHAEHCLTVAAYGVILSAEFGADPAPVFVAGLSHHLHNAGVPDSGFTGEELLGDHLEKIAARFRGSALAELPDPVRAEAEASLSLAGHADTPEARAFHAADVLDRVLQMRHYERQAGFSLDQALEEMELVHAGPLKEFQDAVLSRSGLL